MIEEIKDKKFYELKTSFDAFYDRVLRPKLNEIDKIRKKYLSMFFALLGLAFIFYPLMVIYLWNLETTSEEFNIAGVILVLSGVIIMILNAPMYFYKKKAKPEIMEDFAGFFGTFSYDQGRCLPDQLLRDSYLFGSYRQHSGDDFFSGNYNDVGIIISEELLKDDERYYNSRTKSYETKTKLVFDGICILLTMNKNFSGQTVVKKDRGLLNVLNRVGGMERVRLEDMNFEDLFEVYSTDQIEARYLLTTAFMLRILRLRDLFGGKSIQFSFKNNKVLISISTRQNMFEACSFFRSNVNKKKADLVFEQFYTVFSIIDVLKLNQKIGF